MLPYLKVGMVCCVSEAFCLATSCITILSAHAALIIFLNFLFENIIFKKKNLDCFRTLVFSAPFLYFLPPSQLFPDCIQKYISAGIFSLLWHMGSRTDKAVHSVQHWGIPVSPENSLNFHLVWPKAILEHLANKWWQLFKEQRNAYAKQWEVFNV